MPRDPLSSPRTLLPAIRSGSQGLNGDVYTKDGARVFWSTDASGVTRVSVADGVETRTRKIQIGGSQGSSTRSPAPAWTTGDIGGIHGWIFVRGNRRAFVTGEVRDNNVEVWTINVVDLDTGNLVSETTDVDLRRAKKLGEAYTRPPRRELSVAEQDARRHKADATRERNRQPFVIDGDTTGFRNRSKSDAIQQAKTLSWSTPHQVHVRKGGVHIGYAYKGSWYPS